jgi:hypothetical protein
MISLGRIILLLITIGMIFANISWSEEEKPYERIELVDEKLVTYYHEEAYVLLHLIRANKFRAFWMDLLEGKPGKEEIAAILGRGVPLSFELASSVFKEQNLKTEEYLHVEKTAAPPQKDKKKRCRP